MKIGTHLKKIRTDLNMSQQQLADKTNLKVSVISRWEREDNNPNLEASIKLADALGVSMDVFCNKKVSEVSELEKIAKIATKLPIKKQQVIIQVINAFLKS